MLGSAAAWELAGMPMMMKMEGLTDFNAGSQKNWIWNGFFPPIVMILVAM